MHDSLIRCVHKSDLYKLISMSDSSDSKFVDAWNAVPSHQIPMITGTYELGKGIITLKKNIGCLKSTISRHLHEYDYEKWNHVHDECGAFCGLDKLDAVEGLFENDVIDRMKNSERYGGYCPIIVPFDSVHVQIECPFSVEDLPNNHSFLLPDQHNELRNIRISVSQRLVYDKLLFNITPSIVCTGEWGDMDPAVYPDGILPEIYYCLPVNNDTFFTKITHNKVAELLQKAMSEINLPYVLDTSPTIVTLN